MQSTHTSWIHYSLIFFLSWGRVLEATGSVLSLPGLPSSTGALAPSIRVMIDRTKVNVTCCLPSDGRLLLPVLVNGEQILGLEDFEVLVDLGKQGDGEARYDIMS